MITAGSLLRVRRGPAVRRILRGGRWARVADRLVALRRRFGAPPALVVDAGIAVVCYLATVAVPVRRPTGRLVAVRARRARVGAAGVAAPLAGRRRRGGRRRHDRPGGHRGAGLHPAAVRAAGRHVHGGRAVPAAVAAAGHAGHRRRDRSSVAGPCSAWVRPRWAPPVLPFVGRVRAGHRGAGPPGPDRDAGGAARPARRGAARPRRSGNGSGSPARSTTSWPTR